MSKIEAYLESLQTPQVAAVYRTLSEAHPLEATRRKEVQNALQTSWCEWQITEPLTTAILFLPYVENAPELWQKATADLPSDIVQLVHDWHHLHLFTAQSAAVNKNLLDAYSLKLRHLMRLAYLNLPLVLLTIAEHDGRLQTAADGRTAIELWRETEHVYIPLLSTIGLWHRRNEYINKAIRRLYPDQSKKAAQALDNERLIKEQVFIALENDFADYARIYGLDFERQLHFTSPEKIVYKMRHEGRRLDELTKRIAIVLVTNTRQKCYQLLDLVHHLGTPQRNRFADYMATPKHNGYKALQTIIDVSTSQSSSNFVHFRIISTGMQQLNDKGIIHSQYGAPPHGGDEHAWWNRRAKDPQVLDILNQRNIGDTQPEDAYVYVFTHQGEVKILKKASAAIDFAYSLHTEVGDHCREVMANGRQVPHETLLNNGDWLKLHVDRRFEGPHPSWLRAARRPSTRAHIKKALGTAPEITTHPVQNNLYKLLASLKRESEFVVPRPQIETYLSELAEELNLGTIDNLFNVMQRPRELGRPPIFVEGIVSYILEKELHSVVLRQDNQPVTAEITRPVRFKYPILRFCPNCKPTPGAPIILHTRKRKGKTYYTLHRAKGTEQRLYGLPRKAIKCFSRIPADELEDVMWGETRTGQQIFNLTILAQDHPGLVGKILKPIYDNDRIDLIRINAGVDPDGLADVQLTVECDKWEQGIQLGNQLERILPDSRVSCWPIGSPRPSRALQLRNPYSTGIPVSEKRMFFGRDSELLQLRNYLDPSNPARLIVMHGHRRCGKSSFAHMQSHFLLGQPIVPVYIDLQNIFELSPAAIYAEMAQAIADKLTEQFTDSQLHAPAAEAFNPNPQRTMVAYLRRLSERIAPHRLLVMLDEFNILVSEQPHSPFFRQLRALTARPDTTVLTLMPIIHTSQYKNVQYQKHSHPVNILFEHQQVLHIRFLDHESARRLVKDPLLGQIHIDEEVISQIVTGTNGNPYLIHIICYRLIERLEKQNRSHIRQSDLEWVLNRDIYTSLIHFNFLHTHIKERPQTWPLVRAIAQLQAHRKDWLRLEDVLSADGFAAQADEHDTNEALNYLERHGIIERRDLDYVNRPEQVRIPISYFCHWVCRHPAYFTGNPE